MHEDRIEGKMSGKNNQKNQKKQEPPAEQPQPEDEPIGYADEDSKPLPNGRHEVLMRPMAVPEPTAEERIALLESRLADVERWTTKHNRYHFGGMTGQ